MFCPPPEEETQILKNVLPTKKHRKIKKKNKKHNLKKEAKKRQAKFANTMSAWAENYAVAATWQLKHQLAYWKARAKALEYENNVLHDVIRRNHFTGNRSTTNTESESRTATDTRTETEFEETATDSDTDDEEIEEGNHLEVSEEYIQFLTANVKFKEDAKRERERLKAKIEEENAINTKEELRETVEENRERMKGLYGDQWQRISALEMSLLSSFIHESDKSKPMYWPNIPFNFNCS